MDRKSSKSKVISGIKELGHTVSVADIAAKTGLSLTESRITLNQIAHETHAVLQVSPKGDIAYKFFPDLESIYRIVGIKKLLHKIWALVYDIGFYLLRISFGVLLIASVLTILVIFSIALILIMFGADAADGDMDMSAGDLDFDFFDWDTIALFFSWSVLFRHQTPTSDPDDEYMGIKIDTPDKGFFNNCFSFLFGEGNPNHGLENKQWQFIAERIRLANGVVTADQIAPYLLNTKADSKAMLELMCRFDGNPEVTRSGNIVYAFPSLQVTASGGKLRMPLPEMIEEKEWKFSRVPVDRLHWVFFFAGANLCGSYALNKHLAWFAPLLPYADLIHVMMIYAIFFMSFPVARELLNTVRNALIELRNKKRSKSLAYLNSNESRYKIAEAQQFAARLQNITAQAPVYSTDANVLEQESDGLAAKFAELPAAVKIPGQFIEQNNLAKH